MHIFSLMTMASDISAVDIKKKPSNSPSPRKLKGSKINAVSIFSLSCMNSYGFRHVNKNLVQFNKQVVLALNLPRFSVVSLLCISVF